MSVLHRPSRHSSSAPTQREMPMPQQRSAPASETGPGDTALRPSAPPVQTTPPVQPTTERDRRRVTLIVSGGLVAALAIGAGAYLILEDDGGSAKVIAPAVVNVPDFADLARDRAMAARGPKPFDATEAKRDAALARRAQNFPAGAISGSATSAASDADRISEAQRDAALARRARNFTAE